MKNLLSALRTSMPVGKIYTHTRNRDTISVDRVIPNSPVIPLSLAQLANSLLGFLDTQSKPSEAELRKEKEVMRHPLSTISRPNCHEAPFVL